MSEHNHSYPHEGGSTPTTVFLYSSSAVDKALDTNTVVTRLGLVYVPELLLMSLMGGPGGDPNFDPETAWKIIRDSDGGTVFVWSAP